MGQQNMLYTGPVLDTEHGHIHPEPSVVPYGGIPSFPQPSINPQHLPENEPFTQFNGLDHYPHHSANNVFMTPNGAQVFPTAISLGFQDQLALSSIHGRFENGHFIDVFKRKNAEGFVGNIQYFYPTPGSSSSIVIPMNTEGGIMDGPSLVMEPAVHRSGRNRVSGAIGVDPVLAHSSSHLIPDNYGGQPFQAVPNPWLDQQFWGNGGVAFSWNHNIPGTFVHPPAIMTHQGPHNIHHQPPPMQCSNIDFHSQVASSSRRHSTNATVNPFQNEMETPMPRFVGPARVSRPHRRELMVEATARHRVFPHLRVLPEDGVAILDFSGYHEAGHSVDHHRDMRLDIDHMSYEELLALGEHIGSAGSGLSSDFILKHLKTRVFASLKSSSEPEDAPSADQELDSCIICQTNYDDQEQIGALDCGHEYHVECVKKWMTMKNTCPVCKSTALAAKAKES